MYPIDFDTCTMRDVIERSLVCHPSLFADAIETARATHERYMMQTANSEARRAARGLTVDCSLILVALNTLDTGEALDVITEETSLSVIAFDAAARLNAIPRSLWSDIVERSQSVPA